MDNNTNKRRFDYVDLLKTIAIFFVLIYHFSIINIDFIHNEDWTCYLNYYLKSILSTCVPLFFFVNGGLLMNKSDLDIKKHVRKVIKIILLTIVWGIITLILLSLIKGEHLTFNEIIGGAFFHKQGRIKHLWFFEAMVVIYIFYPLLFNTIKTSPKAFYFFAAAVFIFTFLNTFIGEFAKLISVTLKVFESTNFESKNYFSEFNALRGIYGYSIGYFILGGILFNYQKQVRTQKAMILSIVLLPISMGLLVLYGVKVSESQHKIWDTVWNGYDSIFTCINVILLFTLSLYYKHSGTFGKIVRIIAENSLGIYLIHLIIKPIITSAIPLSGTLGTLVFAVSSLFLSLFIALTIKKIPIVRNLLSLQ
ncbi:MAG TPA: acyltransferase family protein [Bacteroidales bacterium]